MQASFYQPACVVITAKNDRIKKLPQMTKFYGGFYVIIISDAWAATAIIAGLFFRFPALSMTRL